MHVGEVDQERETEWDSSSSTLHNDDDGMERKQCWSGGMDNADSRKVAKAERKAAKNQVLFDVISQDDLNKVEKALHPDSEHQTREISKGQGLADNHTIEQNIAYNANTYQWGKLRQGVHAKKMAKNNGGKQRQNTQQDNEILEPIFASLRISTNISKTSKERKSLDSRLRAAILGDLVASENDQAETMQRMAGYWRYVNKRTYNEMVRNNELWDWATGEKLPEIREDVELELDVIEEEDESAGDGTLNREIERQIPEHWDDPGIEFWDESADLTKHGPETLNGLPNPRSPLSPMTSNPLDKGFQGVKDTRVFEKAIRKASPPFKNPPCAPPQPERIALVPVATLNKELQDLLNRFGCLKREVPAPCEEVKKADPPPLVKSVVKFPAKPIVKTLAIHSELDNWRTIQRPKGKKGAKNGPAVVALREQAAVNVLARKLAGGKTFAAMVKKGL